MIVIAAGLMAVNYLWSGSRFTTAELEQMAISDSSLGRAAFPLLLCMGAGGASFCLPDKYRESRIVLTSVALSLFAITFVTMIYRDKAVEGPAMRAYFNSFRANERPSPDMVALLVVVRDELERMKTSGGGSTLDLAALSRLVDDRIPADKRDLKAGNN